MIKGVFYHSFVLPIKIMIGEKYRKEEDIPKDLKDKMHYYDVTFEECQRAMR